MRKSEIFKVSRSRDQVFDQVDDFFTRANTARTKFLFKETAPGDVSLSEFYRGARRIGSIPGAIDDRQSVSLVEYFKATPPNRGMRTLFGTLLEVSIDTDTQIESRHKVQLYRYALQPPPTEGLLFLTAATVKAGKANNLELMRGVVERPANQIENHLARQPFYDLIQKIGEVGMPFGVNLPGVATAGRGK